MKTSRYGGSLWLFILTWLAFSQIPVVTGFQLDFANLLAPLETFNNLRPSPKTLSKFQTELEYATGALSKIKYGVQSKSSETFNNLRPSPKTLSKFQTELEYATDALSKIKDGVQSKSSQVVDSILSRAATQEFLKKITAVSKTLENRAYESYCSVLTDPRTHDTAIRFQKLNKQTFDAWDKVLANPNAVDAREKYDAMLKRSNEAYNELLTKSPSARKFAKSTKEAYERYKATCGEYPVTCSLLTGGIAQAIFPSSFILKLFGFTRAGPGAGTLASLIQRKVYGAAVPRGSFFSALQRWAMLGVPSGVEAGVVGTPVALLSMEMWLNPGDYCKDYKKR